MLRTLLCLLVLVENILCCTIKTWNPFHPRNKHFAALILARGGSKSIPLKNLSLIGNLTLLEKSLGVIESAQVFDSIWVSTDNEEIALKASRVNVHYNVNNNVSGDFSSSIDAVKYFLTFHKEIDILALVQCTSPFLNRNHLKRGVSILRSGEECSFAVTKNTKLHWGRTSNGIFPVNFDPKSRPRRQDIKNQFTENGMFYISTRKLLNSGYFQNRR
ncbi:N-acylneuraminate cytidylyltransferase A [Onthophagus taurus]|uniref:N-acylneuraminate cytidylyltransferase A n=1 Tax=Onthophagus taurus TaxID=166361 RepID=UPI0039BE5622